MALGVLVGACGEPAAEVAPGADAEVVEAPALEPLVVAEPVSSEPAAELSLPALRERIAARLEASDGDGALDDMEVFVWRFGAAPSASSYREQLTAAGRAVRERPPLPRPRRSLSEPIRRVEVHHPRDPHPRLLVPPPVIRGSLPREIAFRVIRRNQGALRSCFERAAQRRPFRRARGALQLVVLADGRVAAARATRPPLRDAELTACLVGQVRRWRFPTSNVAGVNVLDVELRVTWD